MLLHALLCCANRQRRSRPHRLALLTKDGKLWRTRKARPQPTVQPGTFAKMIGNLPRGKWLAFLLMPLTLAAVLMNVVVSHGSCALTSRMKLRMPSTWSKVQSVTKMIIPWHSFLTVAFRNLAHGRSQPSSCEFLAHAMVDCSWRKFGLLNVDPTRPRSAHGLKRLWLSPSRHAVLQTKESIVMSYVCQSIGITHQLLGRKFNVAQHKVSVPGPWAMEWNHFLLWILGIFSNAAHIVSVALCVFQLLQMRRSFSINLGSHLIQLNTAGFVMS